MTLALVPFAICEVGVSLPAQVPDTVEFSVLISPADKRYVEVDGAIITSGVAVPFQEGKVVNLVARPSGCGLGVRALGSRAGSSRFGIAA